MSKKVLIAYANEPMKYSLMFLKFQARWSGVFDKVITYSEKDIPDEIRNIQEYKCKRGGGYWIWKPYIIWKTLQDVEDGDFVCYIDSACLINKGTEWDMYFSLLNRYDTVCFQYDNFISSWDEKMGCGSSKIKYWTKRETLDFFDNYLNTTEYNDYSKIMAGVIFAKGKDNHLINEWLDITLKNSSLISDPKPSDVQYDFFSGYHRHDQSIFTPLVWKYRDTKSVKVLSECFDECTKSKIIYAARKRLYSRRQYVKAVISYFCNHIIEIFKFDDA